MHVLFFFSLLFSLFLLVMLALGQVDVLHVDVPSQCTPPWALLFALPASTSCLVQVVIKTSVFYVLATVSRNDVDICV